MPKQHDVARSRRRAPRRRTPAISSSSASIRSAIVSQPRRLATSGVPAGAPQRRVPISQLGVRTDPLGDARLASAEQHLVDLIGPDNAAGMLGLDGQRSDRSPHDRSARGDVAGFQRRGRISKTLRFRAGRGRLLVPRADMPGSMGSERSRLATEGLMNQNEARDCSGASVGEAVVFQPGAALVALDCAANAADTGALAFSDQAAQHDPLPQLSGAWREREPGRISLGHYSHGIVVQQQRRRSVSRVKIWHNVTLSAVQSPRASRQVDRPVPARQISHRG